jgi:hypothetical protein
MLKLSAIDAEPAFQTQFTVCSLEVRDAVVYVLQACAPAAGG